MLFGRVDASIVALTVKTGAWSSRNYSTVIINLRSTFQSRHSSRAWSRLIKVLRLVTSGCTARAKDEQLTAEQSDTTKRLGRSRMLYTHITIAASKAKNIGDESIPRKGAGSESLSSAVCPTFLPSGHPSGLCTLLGLHVKVLDPCCESHDEVRMLSRGV